MGKVLFPDNPHLVFHTLFDSPGYLPIPLPAALEGRLVKAVKCLPVIHILKAGEYDPVKIPIRKAGFSNFPGIGYGDRCMGKLVDHGAG